jgi:two-component system invasion response regulator UvrY
MSKVLLVDDHQVVRDGLKTIMREQCIGDVFGEATTAVEALKLAADHTWDLAVVDISLVGRSGLELVRELKQLRPRMPILMLSMHSEEQYARRAFKAGAAGYITKDSSRAELAGAIAKVIAGGRYISPALAERLVVDLERDADRPPHHALSGREFEVMRLMGSGKTVGAIAEILSLSDKTVSTYRARILEKMHLNTTAELIRYVVENNLMD